MNTPRYFRIESEGDVLILAASRRITGLVEDEVQEECEAVLRELGDQKSKHAIIDLTGLDYFGSIVLELMVKVWKKVHAGGGKLIICCVSDVAREILETAKFDSIWPILPSREDAMAALKS